MVAQTPSDRIQPVKIEEEMRQAYLDYAMSVITSRALPDVRDGLKPVQRRILFSMHELGLRSTSAYRKSAKITGEVMGKYHPHGDAPIYDALVRMAQEWSMRYPLVDGQGNFGCFTGDTKIKLLDGTERSFAELSELPPDQPFYVYSVNAEGRITIGKGHASRITRRNAQVIELTFDDGSTVRCTPDHRFMLRDGGWEQVQHLTIDDSLMAGYFDTAPLNPRANDYLRVRQPATGEYEFVHWLADEYNERNGRTRPVAGPFVRHHKNFDRFDNRPDNIERLSWLEHFHVHGEHIEALWSRDDFRAAQRAGVQQYYVANPQAVEARRQRMIARNQDPAFRLANAPRVAKALRERHARDPEPARTRGEHLRQLWADPDYRARMSVAMRGIEKRPLTAEQKAEAARIISEKSRAMWQDEAMRRRFTDAIVAAMSDKSLRASLSENAKQLWLDPAYRAKYAPDHHSRMARKLWSDPAMRAMHRAKVSRQWQDPAFRAANAEARRRDYERRIAANPGAMTELASSAGVSLRQKWGDPSYKRRVMRSKIAGYASRLLAELGHGAITPEVYDARRTRNWIPDSTKVLRYFDSFEELIQAATTHNHRVVGIRWLERRVDVYDITVDEHHNFMLANGCIVHNSVDGDPPAAQRYTEARLAAIADELLTDIDKNTVDMVDNYDATEQQPVVLPARLPNLLVNGSAGIAVGMATNIPPHNLGEVCDAIARVIDKPDTSTEELARIVKGPDFPTAGIIIGREGIKQAFATGQGKIVLRARTQIEEMARGGRYQIVVSELPYQVNKAELIKKIAELVKDKRVDGIADLRDESDRNGMRMVIELARGGQAKQVLNSLYKHTAMQTSFGVHMLCLVNGQPKTVNLLTALRQFIDFRREVIRRRTEFDLAKAKEREHILAGLLRALDRLDAIIRLIRNAPSAAEAKNQLMARPFSFSDRQAQAILDMQLRRLAALERKQLQDEHAELVKRIAYLEDLLANPKKIDALIKEESLELKKKHGDARRTQIIEQELEDFSEEDLIPHEDVVVTISNRGYIKRVPLDTYRRQRRGGKGVTGMVTREEDAVRRLVVADTHAQLLFFTDRGRVFPLKVHEVPDAGRTAKGIPLINVVDIAQGELVTAIVGIESFDKDCLVMATKLGEVKRTPLSEFSSIRRNGLIAMNLEDSDELISARTARDTDDLIIASAEGQAMRFPVRDLRMASRMSGGVRGIRLGKNDAVVAMEIVEPKAELLTLSTNGFGKRTPLNQYPAKGRGGGGVIGFKVTAKTGPVAAARVVDGTRELMLISQDGIVLRTSVDSIARTGRATSGVTVMKLAPADRVASIASIDAGSKGEEPDPQPKDSSNRRASATPNVPPDGKTSATPAPKAGDTVKATKLAKAPPARQPGSNRHHLVNGRNGRKGRQ